MSCIPSVFYVRIDHWHPTPLNELLNCHWAERGRKKKADAQIVGVSVRGADVPRASLPRLVALEITLGKGQRAADPDAYWKSLLDGLVACGALKDDSRQWCHLGEVSFVRGERPRTVIRLENVSAYYNNQPGAEPHEYPVSGDPQLKTIMRRHGSRLD